MEEQWGLVTFEFNPKTDDAHFHPPEIAGAADLCNEQRSPQLCILTHMRREPDKIYRDYYLSPATLRLCGRHYFLNLEMAFCEPPNNVLGSYPVTGCQELFANRNALP
jgi:hypothetical protein